MCRFKILDLCCRVEFNGDGRRKNQTRRSKFLNELRHFLTSSPVFRISAPFSHSKPVITVLVCTSNMFNL
ncbi:hypothetical protein Hanom_Chr09g00833451 [Helianthus anomalus]